MGYLACSSMKNGNYWGVIECADSVLNKIPDEMELEQVLIKSRQVRPLLRLGNYGQVVNLVDTEIMPVIEKYLTKGKNTAVISITDLYETWLEVYFDFAEAFPARIGRSHIPHQLPAGTTALPARRQGERPARPASTCPADRRPG